MQARRTFQVKRTGPNGKDFPLPLSELCLPVSQDFHWQWGGRGWGVCPVRGPPRRVNPASGLSTRSFLPCVSKRKRRRREKSKGKKETKGGEGGRGPPFNASRQNSLNARESSCRCRFSPFSPLPPLPLPFLFFSLHDVCRLFHLANPAVPLHYHPISAPRESTLRTSAAIALSTPFRLFSDKGRQSGGEI